MCVLCRVWLWFRLPLIVAPLILSACAAPVHTSGAAIDWVPFLRFDGITYLEPFSSSKIGRSLQAGDLGPEFAQARHTVADSVHTPGYQLQDGDAAFLPVRTPVFRVRGYDAAFRLAARQQGRLVLYEADTNPRARVGQDLLDIGGKVRSISVLSSQDGTTELAAISDPVTVAALVAMVLGAPVDQGEHDDTGTRYFVAFQLRDGTATVRSYWPSSGELSRGIMLPEAFATAIGRAVASGATAVASTAGIDNGARMLAGQFGLL